ncbi:Asp23/Gls24 family envelope stress response protein [Micromonospora sp. NPDC048930]|uniref:Asp23/Gls24 family envelope stress response protein n=1 Tax=Micromonospora sp. NPDC048930 TaxID=3364261 RepID=UPI00371AC46D
MTGTLPRRANAPPAGAPPRHATAPPAGSRPPHATAPPRGTRPPRGAAAPPGTRPPRGAAVPRAVAPWTEEEIARLAEDAARRTPAVSAPAATVRIDGPAARVDLDVVVTHGVHLPTAAEGVRRRVTAGIEAYTGRTVEAVTVTVVGLRLPGEAPAPGGHPGDDREAT